MELPARRRHQPRHYIFSSGPRTIRDIIAGFEIARQQATPDAEYKPD
jgi:hypothetical protein